MNELFCEEWLFLPTNAEFKDLLGTVITNCILNNFLTYTAIMLNIVTICAMRKTSNLAKNLKMLLTSLAISDVSVGLVGQPTYISFLVSWLNLKVPSCNAYRWLNISGVFFSLASFLGVLAISTDRFLAVYLHVRYQEIVTHRCVVAALVSMWVFCAFVSLMILWVSTSTYNIIISVTGTCGFVVTIVMYIKIYLIVQRHKNKIQSLQVHEVSQSREMKKSAGLIKSTSGVFYVYLVFLFCYLPYAISVVAAKINGPSITLKRLFLFSMTLAYLNSSLNPVIYCWKVRYIRHAIMDTLRNISWIYDRKHPSH